MPRRALTRGPRRDKPHALPEDNVLFLLLSVAFAEDLWVTAPVEGVRWPDVTTVSVTLAEGDKVEVLVRDGDKARVRKGTDFGWIPAADLTDVAPATPAGVPGEAGEFPTITLPGAEEKPAAEAPVGAPSGAPAPAPAKPSVPSPK